MSTRVVRDPADGQYLIICGDCGLVDAVKRPAQARIAAVAHRRECPAARIAHVNRLNHMADHRRRGDPTTT